MVIRIRFPGFNVGFDYYFDLLIWSVYFFSNRAFCYSQLELHKHVIKDCNKALQLDPELLQAYIFKGHLCVFLYLVRLN